MIHACENYRLKKGTSPSISWPKFLFHTVRIIEVVLWFGGFKWHTAQELVLSCSIHRVSLFSWIAGSNWSRKIEFFPPKTVCVESSFSVFIELNTVYKCLTYQELNAPALAFSTTLKHDKEPSQNNTDILSAQYWLKCIISASSFHEQIFICKKIRDIFLSHIESGTND